MYTLLSNHLTRLSRSKSILLNVLFSEDAIISKQEIEDLYKQGNQVATKQRRDDDVTFRRHTSVSQSERSKKRRERYRSAPVPNHQNQPTPGPTY